MPSKPDDATRAAIARAAQEQGVDPATALAIAERESSFNPRAKSSKTIRGLYQMRGDLRQQYGVGDSTDAYTQAKGWMPFFKDTKSTMSRSLGRPVTDAEGYTGHYFGAGRAARMLKMDPQTPVDQVFTPNERSINPNFDKAGTVGALIASTTSDIDRRRAAFAGSGQNSTLEAGPAKTADSIGLDISELEPMDQTAGPRIRVAAASPTPASPALDIDELEPADDNAAPMPQQSASALDLSELEPA